MSYLYRSTWLCGVGAALGAAGGRWFQVPVKRPSWSGWRCGALWRSGPLLSEVGSMVWRTNSTAVARHPPAAAPADVPAAA